MAYNRLSDIDPRNTHFVGRKNELRRLHQILAANRIVVLTAVNGLEGIGATSLAIEYAHVFQSEYGGGCRQIDCRGSKNVADEILAELSHLAAARDSQHGLLIVDEVNQPELFDAKQLLGGVDTSWLHVIVTTRSVRRDQLAYGYDLPIIALNALSEAEAVELIESFQPRGKFAEEKDREAAREIVSLLGRYTIAVEAAAVCLGQFAGEVTFAHFLQELRTSGLDLETTESEALAARRLAAALRPTFERLTKLEMKVLVYAAWSWTDEIVLSQVRESMSAEFSQFEIDSEVYRPDPWPALVHRLFRLRLWQPTNIKDDGQQVARMHPLVKETVRRNREPDPRFSVMRQVFLLDHEPRERSSMALVKAPEKPELQDTAAVKETSQPRVPQAFDENVMFTVYRRKTVAPNKWYPLLAFAHLSERPPDAPPDEPDPIAEVKRQAEAVLGQTIDEYRQSSQDSTRPVPHSGELTFKPYAPGVEFNPSSRTFRWEEHVHREEFKMRAAMDLDGQTTRGWLRVYLGPLIIAEVNLTFTIDSKTAAQTVRPDAVEHGRALRKVFASYSHKDRQIVERIEKIASETYLGIEYLRDVTNLRSGEIWSDELMRMIEAADIFQLFWSTNSMHSQYVRQEYEYALSRRRPDFVRPVYWEEPFPKRAEEGLPPEELARLHFEKIPIDTHERRAGGNVVTKSARDRVETITLGGAPAAGRFDADDFSRVPTAELAPPPPPGYPPGADYSLAPSTSTYDRGDVFPESRPSIRAAGLPVMAAPPSRDALEPERRRGSLVLKIISVTAMMVPIIIAPLLLLASTMSLSSSEGASSGISLLLLLLLFGCGLLFIAGLGLFIFQRNR